MFEGIIISVLGTILICFIGVVIKKTGLHADRKHEWIAKLVRKSYTKYGLYECWKEPDGTFHLICFISEGVYGDWVVVQGRGNKVFEKTAFIPKEGNINEIHLWLSRKNSVEVFDFEKEIDNGHD